MTKQGSGIITVSIIIAVLAALSAGGYMIYQQARSNYDYELSENTEVVSVSDDASTPVVTSKQEDETADWKTYKNEKYGFEFKYPAEYLIQEMEQYGVRDILFYDSKVGDFSSLRLNLSIDMDPLSGADPLLALRTPGNSVGGKYLVIGSKQATKHQIRWSYQGQEYLHDLLVIKKTGLIIALASVGINPNTAVFDRVMGTFKLTEPSLAIFDKVQFRFPKSSCDGPCSSKDDRLYVGDNLLQSLQVVGKDYTGAIEEDYGVVSGVTYCANSCLQTFLILVGGINSQPRQLDDVYLGLNPYIRSIKLSDRVVTVEYVPGGGIKVTQDNPETKTVSYRIVNDQLVRID